MLMTNSNSDLKNNRWIFMILHVRVSVSIFLLNLFEVFTSIHRLFSILSLWWWFKGKNEKVLWIYLEIRMRRRRNLWWIFSEFLVNDLLLLNWWRSSSSSSLVWFCFFNSSSSPLWSYKLSELVLELQFLSSMMKIRIRISEDFVNLASIWLNLWFWKQLGFYECSSVFFMFLLFLAFWS
jgi:hypothetical protein